MIRIAPGDPLQMMPAARHYLLNWNAARKANRAASGEPPAAVLPPIDPQVVRSILLDHVRSWPTWVDAMATAGGQSYAVLTVCRAVVALLHHEELSKRAAAVTASRMFPSWAELIGWAQAWWYERGADEAPPRTAEVRAFVKYASSHTLSLAARPH